MGQIPSHGSGGSGHHGSWHATDHTSDDEGEGYDDSMRNSASNRLGSHPYRLLRVVIIISRKRLFGFDPNFKSDWDAVDHTRLVVVPLAIRNNKPPGFTQVSHCFAYLSRYRKLHCCSHLACYYGRLHSKTTETTCANRSVAFGRARRSGFGRSKGLSGRRGPVWRTTVSLFLCVLGYAVFINTLWWLYEVGRLPDNRRVALQVYDTVHRLNMMIYRYSYGRAIHRSLIYSDPPQ